MDFIDVQITREWVSGLSKEIKEALGEIEDTFTCIIYGESGHGKTNMTVQLLKELKSLGNMLYISYEEAHGKSIQDLIFRHRLDEEIPNLQFSDGETIDELVTYLKKKQSPKVIVLDSWQYSEFTFEDYKRLKDEFVFGRTSGRRKIFIIISHVNGSKPDGKGAVEVKRDCNIKIHVSHFVGFITSRFSGSIKNFCIYDSGAKNHYGKDLNKVINKVRIEKKRGKEGIGKEDKSETEGKSEVAKEDKRVKGKVQVLPPETEEEVAEAMLKKLREGV